MKKREYHVVTSFNGEQKEDCCGCFMSVLCLIVAKLWGKFEIVKLERCEFYE